MYIRCVYAYMIYVLALDMELTLVVSYLAPLKYMLLQVLDSYSDGLYLYFLDMLCAIKGVCHSCINAIALSCIRKTSS